jgi:hypothetical protein
MMKRRIFRIVPVAIAVALSVAACGGPSLGGSGTASTSSGSGSGVSFGASGFGTAAGASGVANSMTADQVAGFCTKFPYSPTIEHGTGGVNAYTELQKFTPPQLAPYVQVMLVDNQAIASERRVFAQLKDEMMANFQPLDDFRGQVCEAH